MTLANLYNIPDFNDARAVAQFSFNNDDQHRQIVAQIRAQMGTQLQIYELDPLALYDLDNWLLRHQTMHNNMNTALGNEGQDLSELNVKNPQELSAWIWLHAFEHRNANLKLGI